MSIQDYQSLLARKAIVFEPHGLTRIPKLNKNLFPHQQSVVEFALRTGCSGAFLATGMGKSLVALDWARVMVEHTNKPALMLAPLAVSNQHEREAHKFGIDAKAIREPHEISGARVYVTNYERLDKFDTSQFGAVVIDESSILKGFNGRTSRAIITAFEGCPYRLSASATPAPNDHMELGQQSDFLGVMRSMEMLSRWFINDTSTASQVWRLKGHAVEPFWDWVASWSRCMAKPSDLGFSDDGFDLPELIVKTHLVEADRSVNPGAEKDGQHRLFRLPETSATSIHAEKRMTSSSRAQLVKNLVDAEPNEPWIIWVDTQYEADEIMRLLPSAVEISGKMSADEKEEKIIGFSNGTIKHLVTKSSITGFGLNWHHCARMAFMGLSFSFESYHQAVRRCWRFGQKRPVHVHIAMADTEKAIIDVITRKQDGFETMGTAMRAAMSRAVNLQKARIPYAPASRVQIPSFMRG
jgi:hypothetical protein